MVMCDLDLNSHSARTVHDGANLQRLGCIRPLLRVHLAHIEATTAVEIESRHTKRDHNKRDNAINALAAQV